MMQSVNYCAPQTTVSMQREQRIELSCDGRQSRRSRCLVNSRCRRSNLRNMKLSARRGVTPRGLEALFLV